MLRDVAAETLGLQVNLPDEVFRRALDPRAFVESRNLPGGAAPRATADVLDKQGVAIKQDRAWLTDVRALLSSADQLLQEEVSELTR